MAFKRIGTLVVVLALSACSHPPLMPTAYSSLPAASPASVSSTGPIVVSAPPRVEADLGPIPVIIPGTLKLQEDEIGRHGVNPLAVLDSSARSRATWKTFRPDNLTRPPVYTGLSRMSNGLDAGSTSAPRKATAPGFDRELAMKIIPSEYNREATMATLLKGGRDAAKSICSGC
jgi:hypothetical protein